MTKELERSEGRSLVTMVSTSMEIKSDFRYNEGAIAQNQLSDISKADNSLTGKVRVMTLNHNM